MRNSWAFLAGVKAEPQTPTNWLVEMLSRNSGAAYLQEFGCPKTRDEFRSWVPVCKYESLLQHLARMQSGEPNVLFGGRPVAYERTGGSSGGQKLIPYSQEGLLDFQRNVLPWLGETVARYGIGGRAYFSISPATRKPECVGQVPVGLPDGAYLGNEAGQVLLRQTAVPIEVGALTELTSWREATLRHLAQASDLELISVWSPTFLLRLLDELPDAIQLWPRLKVVSCWASGPARRYAEELRTRLPHAVLQPKGLLSTEAVVTVPDEDARPALVSHGFYEFARGGVLHLEDELDRGKTYEVVVTTASGLYRYETGDCVRYDGQNARNRPILEFLGRESLHCDLVGEKLTESFVSDCLQTVSGYALLVPNVECPGYVLIGEQSLSKAEVELIEDQLTANPQYAYARRLGQLAPLKTLVHPYASTVIEQHLLARGTRLGDVKPVALRSEPFWLALFSGAYS